MNAVEDRIAEIMTVTFKIDRSVIGFDTRLATLDFDSLILIQLGLVLEDEFGVVIEVGEVTRNMTIQDVAGLVTGKAVTV